MPNIPEELIDRAIERKVITRRQQIEAIDNKTKLDHFLRYPKRAEGRNGTFIH